MIVEGLEVKGTEVEEGEEVDMVFGGRLNDHGDRSFGEDAFSRPL